MTEQAATQEPSAAELAAASAALEGKTPQEILRWAARRVSAGADAGVQLRRAFGHGAARHDHADRPSVSRSSTSTPTSSSPRRTGCATSSRRSTASSPPATCRCSRRRSRRRSTAKRCGGATPTPAARSARSSRTSAPSTGKRAWISGIRRDQTKQRAGMRDRRVGREVRPGEDQPARRTGRSRRSGRTSSTTASRTTSCTTRTTRASAARTARSP